MCIIHAWEIIRRYTRPINNLYQQYVTVYRCSKCGATKEDKEVGLI